MNSIVNMANGWRLFWMATAPVSAIMLVPMLATDTSTGPGVPALIQLSVRCAVPLLFVTFATSSIQSLFPGPFGRWLLRNRKYIGLSFAAAMAWQGFFILWMVTIHADYYINEVYVLRDAIEGVVGYVFLAAMTITSFPFGRRRLSSKQWKWLHKIGIYYLWAYAFSVYWWALFYYRNPVMLDYVYYCLGFAAWAVRAAAWSRSRRRRAAGEVRMAPGLAGVALVASGLLAAGLGLLWYPLAERLLTGYAFTRIPETYLPYWPFAPFLPLVLILAGAACLSAGAAARS